MEKSERMAVEVAYALPQSQRLIDVQVNVGATALDAVLLSGITGEFPDIDPATANMGIFSKPLDGKALPLPQDYQLKARDRVEIYRPLTIDPKEARLARAQKAKAEKAKAEKAKAEKAKQPNAGN